MVKGFLCALTCFGQSVKEAQYVDIGQIPTKSLPDVLLCEDGTRVSSVRLWERKRRPEILHKFETYMFGNIPDAANSKPRWEIESIDVNALNGKAIRKIVKVWPLADNDKYQLSLQIYLPISAVHKPVPVFYAMSFQPNYAVYNDLDVKKPDVLLNSDGRKIPSYKRGAMNEFWQLEKILSAGYGLATFCYQDVVSDNAQDFYNNIPKLYYRAGFSSPQPDEWGAIAFWAWQMRQVMNYLCNDKNIDKRNIIGIGHSRLAKTVLWAGALDKRFSMVIANNSGCCGAALSRRKYGETVLKINQVFPHWFCGNFKQFNDREEYLPFDQHFLIALIAPRPVYIASAEDDNWSDPQGEFWGGKEGSSVYHLYGVNGLESKDMPEVNRPLQDGYIGYHIRSGAHDMTAFDWEQYIHFANKYLKSNK